MVLDAGARGIIDASAIRRLPIPYTLRFPSTTDIASRPILAEHVGCQNAIAPSRTKSSSAAPFKLPGITSRLTKGPSGAELPISRQSSTHAIEAFRSSGCDRILGSIRRGSSGLGPVRRICPRLFGCTTTAASVQELAGGLNLAAVSALHIGISA